MDEAWIQRIVVDKNTNSIGFFFMYPEVEFAIATLYNKNGDLVMCEQIKIEGV